MSLRFRKSVGFFGGLFRLTFSGSGVSASVGVKGARVSVPLNGKRKPRATLSVPGTGLSYQTTLQTGHTLSLMDRARLVREEAARRGMPEANLPLSVFVEALKD